MDGVIFEQGDLIIDKRSNRNGEIREVLPNNDVLIEFENEPVLQRISIEEAKETLLPIDYKRGSSSSQSDKNPFFDLLSTMREGKKEPKKEELPIIQAVVRNDLEEVKRYQDQKLEPNFLGFNAIEIAKHLGRDGCLKILQPQLKKTFKVRTKESRKIKVMDEEEFNHYFGIRYVKQVYFGSYALFKEVLSSCSPIFSSARHMNYIPLGYTQEDMQKFEDAHQFGLRFKKELGEGYICPITIEWIDDVFGYGAFADVDLKEGDYIGCYIGEARRLPRWSRKNDHSIIYGNLSLSTYRIDGTLVRNELPFLNHSSKPNLNGIPIYDRGYIHSAYYANRSISKGTQLCWNYGDDFWAKRVEPQELLT